MIFDENELDTAFEGNLFTPSWYYIKVQSNTGTHRIGARTPSAVCNRSLETILCPCGQGTDGMGSTSLAPCNVMYEPVSVDFSSCVPDRWAVRATVIDMRLASTAQHGGTGESWSGEHMLCYNCGRVYRWPVDHSADGYYEAYETNITDVLTWPEDLREHVFKSGGDWHRFVFGGGVGRSAPITFDIEPEFTYLVQIIAQVSSWELAVSHDTEATWQELAESLGYEKPSVVDKSLIPTAPVNNTELRFWGGTNA